MGKTKKVGSAGRFGARYGSTIRKRVIAVEEKQKKPQICPYCKKPKAKRIASGIWTCKKCNTTFTGKAYTVR